MCFIWRRSSDGGKIIKRLTCRNLNFSWKCKKLNVTYCLFIKCEDSAQPEKKEHICMVLISFSMLLLLSDILMRSSSFPHSPSPSFSASLISISEWTLCSLACHSDLSCPVTISRCVCVCVYCRWSHVSVTTAYLLRRCLQYTWSNFSPPLVLLYIFIKHFVVK